MARVSTFGNHQSALADLMAAQARQLDAQTRVSTRKTATDLAGFGPTSETLTAMKGAQARLQGYLDTGETVAARLATQDLALNRIADGIAAARAAIGDALSADRGDGLMLEMDGALRSVQGGLNTRHLGAYLFAGAAVDRAPVQAATLAELAAAPMTADLFFNDEVKAASRLAEGSSVETGLLADDLGTAAFDVLRDIQAFQAGAGGPFTGRLTEAQKAFLTAQLSRLDAAREGVTDIAAANGSLQARVDATMEDQAAQIATLETLLADRTDADMAQALTDLQWSQLAVQASAQVIGQLRQSSLLDYLR